VVVVVVRSVGGGQPRFCYCSALQLDLLSWMLSSADLS
jgi:hypothetical protein